MIFEITNTKVLNELGRIQQLMQRDYKMNLEKENGGEWVLWFTGANFEAYYKDESDARRDWSSLLQLRQLWTTEKRNAVLRDIAKHADVSMRHIQGLKKSVKALEKMTGHDYYPLRSEFGGGVLEEFLTGLDYIFETAKANQSNR